MSRSSKLTLLFYRSHHYVFNVTLTDNFHYQIQFDDTDTISLCEIKEKMSKLLTDLSIILAVILVIMSVSTFQTDFILCISTCIRLTLISGPKGRFFCITEKLSPMRN
jgi:hypothetical protein